jgi:hypothetical protein
MKDDVTQGQPNFRAATVPSELLPPQEIKRLLASRRCLTEWTIAQLQAEDEPPFDLEYEYMLDDLFWRNQRVIEQQDWLMLTRGRIMVATRAKDYKQVEALVAKSPGELAEFALKVRNRKGGRGRQEHDRRNLSNWDCAMLVEADRCVGRIRDLWKRKLDIVYSPHSWENLAIEIAAEYCGVSVNQLINYRKNKHRI